MESIRYRNAVAWKVLLVLKIFLLMGFTSWLTAADSANDMDQASRDGLATNIEKILRYDPNSQNPYKGLSSKDLWDRKPIIKRGPHEALTEVESVKLKQWSSVLTTTVANPYAGKSASQLMKVKPKIHKVGPWPPENEEDYQIWQWWESIRKADPDQEWKMPIKFYGIVVNQSNQPISEAIVCLRWSAVDGTTPEMTLETDTSGVFSVTNILGKGVSVIVMKSGYRSYISAHQVFEFFDITLLHTPDPTTPVVFRLWEYSNPEPMYKHENLPTVTFDVDDRIVWIDAKKGDLSDAGQIGLSVFRNNPTDWLAGYIITIHAAEGGGVNLPDDKDELMFLAPKGGYKPQIRIEQPPGDVYSAGKKIRFYLRTPDNRYAAMHIDISQYNNAKAAMRTCLIYYNPSGSRDLQYLDDLRLSARRK